MDGGDGGRLRSALCAKGPRQPSARKGSFPPGYTAASCSSPRSAERGGGGGGTEIDASPPCQPAPLLSPSRLLILPVPTWSSSELWSQRRSLCVGETQLVCVCVEIPTRLIRTVASQHRSIAAPGKIRNSNNTNPEFKVQVWGRNLSRHKSLLRDGWVIWGDSLKKPQKAMNSFSWSLNI